ncbi:hypothetical protein ILYODFUR_013184 [Ilyodon furcidens]|uniref:Uncharacterized protein n=1 Tax=Ilyodon furcidens TaxID=33524 RepID=A0ABV0TU79_9TELE
MQLCLTRLSHVWFIRVNLSLHQVYKKVYSLLTHHIKSYRFFSGNYTSDRKKIDLILLSHGGAVYGGRQGCQSIAGQRRHTQDKQPQTHSFTPKGNLEKLINLTCF